MYNIRHKIPHSYHITASMETEGLILLQTTDREPDDKSQSSPETYS